MGKIIERVKVILRAAPTYLVAVSTVITIANEEIVDLLPDAWQGGAANAVVVLLAWLGAAVSIIRRVEPVLPAERGILPPTT